MRTKRWFRKRACAAIGLVCVLFMWRAGACAQVTGGQGDPPGQDNRGGGQPQVGLGPRGPGAQRRPPGPQQAAIAATSDYVFVLIGNTLYQFSAKNLKLVNKATLPEQAREMGPEPQGGPQEGNDQGGQPRDPGGQRPNGADRDQGRLPGSGRGQGIGGPQAYSLEQAISDNAQLHTIAFSGLAFVTGDYGACTFLPPGKVCDFFGFQYMRDIDAAQAGHNPKFLDRVVANVLRILTPAQKQTLEALARQEAEQMNKLALMRLPLIKAFCRNLAGAIPAGSAGLNKAEVVRYVGDIFAFDAQVSYERAKVFGHIATSLTAVQKAYLSKMTFGDFNSWPDLDATAYKLPRGTPKPLNVAYMSCASEFFSWYAGNVEADTYFCPERHGTYFGSFYMKDMPAMGKRDYDISTSVTGDSGKGFLEVLTDEQRAPIVAIPDLQRQNMSEIVSVRRAISQELRKFLAGGQASREKVLALGRRYGELDGEMSYLYATAFAKAGKTLTGEQRARLVKLRNLEGYTSAPAYIYSDPAPFPVHIPSTDHFFFPPDKSAGPPSGGPTAGPDAAGSALRAGFVLRSPAVGPDGVLSVRFTGDGEGISPPLEWSGAPTGTKSYALSMHHVDPEGRTKWYWTLYNIPAATTSLAAGAAGVGVCGNNSINGRIGYAPPHSKGSGTKAYVLTLYALSAPVEIAEEPGKVSRAVLLKAMRDCILATTDMRVSYSRAKAPDGTGDTMER